LKKKASILFSLFLLISFSWQCVSKSFIYLTFKLNQKELAATVCENKDKPKSCCAAKCQLDKEIKKEDKRQSDSSSPIKDKAEKAELRTGLLTFTFDPSLSELELFFNYEKKLSNVFFSSVFHPPSDSPFLS
jgi:hypothetical protein